MSDLHLSDAWINEYLDGALSADQRAQAQAHLATCADCAARAAALQTLFTSLDALPDLPLERDLSVPVLAALRAGARASARRPARLPLRLWTMAALQFALAIALAGAAWPFAVLLFQGSSIPSDFSFWSEALRAELLLLADVWTLTLTSLTQTATGMLQALQPPALSSNSIGGAAALIVLAFLLWVVGNGLLLGKSLLRRF